LVATGGADKVVRLWDVLARRGGRGCYPGWSHGSSSSSSSSSDGRRRRLEGGGERLTVGELAAREADEGGPRAAAWDGSGGLDHGVCLLALPGHTKGVDCVARLSSAEGHAYP
jgi:hypothetical protein